MVECSVGAVRIDRLFDLEAGCGVGNCRALFSFCGAETVILLPAERAMITVMALRDVIEVDPLGSLSSRLLAIDVRLFLF